MKNVERAINNHIQKVESALRDPDYVKQQQGEDSAMYLEALAREDTQIPPEWKNYKGKLKDSLLDFFRQRTYKLADLDPRTDRAVRDMVMKTWKVATAFYRVGAGHDAVGLQGYTTLDIQSVKRIENPSLYHNYTEKRKGVLLKASMNRPKKVDKLGTESEVMTAQQNIAELDRLLVPQINEYFLFHGTKTEVKDGIMKQGLDFRLASEGGLFGQGIYFAESSAKADQYAGKNWEQC